jgi:ectoine hydroxylase-related dioxygenase (phytanoyl-CoA dioxygenase family)
MHGPSGRVDLPDARHSKSAQANDGGVVMRAFRESSDVLHDGPALRARMAEDGYIFLKSLLPREKIIAIRRQMLAILAEAGMIRRDHPVDDAIPDFANFAVEPEPAFMDVLYAEYALQDMNALQHEPVLRSVMETLFDEPVLPIPLFVCRNIFPQREAFTTPAHQDYVHIQGTERNYAAWVPMGDVDEAMGGLAIARGSHRQGLMTVRPALGAGGLESVGQEPLEWVYSPTEIGDVLIHTSLTLHKGVPNRARSMRLSVDYRFQPVSEPICAVNLVPHRGMRTWDDLYRGWTRTDLQHYWRRHDLKVVPFDMRFYEQRDRLAFEMADRGDPTARSALQRIVSNDPDPAKRERAREAMAKLAPVAA